MELERTIRASDLVGISEIAARAHVHPSTPHQWRKRYQDFPAPLVTIGRERVYAWSDVLEWLERRRPYGRHVPRKR